jgi:hypothetical protein
MSNLAMRNLNTNFSGLLVGQHLNYDGIVSFNVSSTQHTHGYSGNLVSTLNDAAANDAYTPEVERRVA